MVVEGVGRLLEEREKVHYKGRGPPTLHRILPMTDLVNVRKKNGDISSIFEILRIGHWLHSCTFHPLLLVRRKYLVCKFLHTILIVQ